MISYQTVISKMKEEIEKAEQTTDHQRISEHARAIRLLADLIVDDEAKEQAQHKYEPTVQKSSQANIDALERQIMMGTKAQNSTTNHPSVNPENMGSLLDF